MLILDSATNLERVYVEGPLRKYISPRAVSFVATNFLRRVSIDDRSLPESAASLWVEIAPYSTLGFVFAQKTCEGDIAYSLEICTSNIH